MERLILLHEADSREFSQIKFDLEGQIKKEMIQKFTSELVRRQITIPERKEGNSFGMVRYEMEAYIMNGQDFRDMMLVLSELKDRVVKSRETLLENKIDYLDRKSVV